MVAESLDTTRDTALALERLSSWPDDVLAADLQRLQVRLDSEDPIQAQQVRALASAVNVGATAGQPAGAQPAAGASLLQRFQWRTACTTGLWALLVIAGIVGVIFLYRRWRATQQQEPVPAIRPSPSSARDSAAGPEYTWSDVDSRTPSQIAEGEKAAWPAAGVSDASAPPWDERQAGPDRDEAYMPPSRRGDQVDRTAAGAAAGAVGAAAGAGRAPVPSGMLTKVSEFRSLFQMGEPDYDEAFDVKDSSGAYIGECGVALVDPVGRGHDQAAALQVWLWDKTDPDTKVKVLMGEGAYRDTALRDQLAKDHSSIAVKPGGIFELDSYNLLLRGTVEKLDYAELEPAYGVFAELQLLLQVFRKG
jgi:hypothetical protein